MIISEKNKAAMIGASNRPQSGLSLRTLLNAILGLLFAGCLIAIPIVRWYWFETDHQFANYYAMVLAFIASGSLWLFLLTLTQLSLLARFGVLIFPMVAISVFSNFFECVGVTGETIPIIRFRSARSTVAESPSTDNADAVTDYTFLVGTNRPSRIPRSTRYHSPQFYGPTRDGIIELEEFNPKWEQHPPSLLWKRTVGAGWSSFVVSHGLAITTEQIHDYEAISAMEIDTGKTVWQHQTSSRHSTALGGLGPRATPTISNGMIYWQTATGKVLCNELLTGHLRWEYDLLSLTQWTQSQSEKAIEWGRSGSPLVAGNLIIVPLGGPEDCAIPRSLVALESTSGTPVWTAGSHQISYSSPVLANLCNITQIVSINENFITGHCPEDGKTLWTSPWPSNSEGQACASQPVVIGSNQIMLGKGYALGSKVIELSCDVDEKSEHRYEPEHWKVRDVWSNPKVLKTKFTSAIFKSPYLYGLSDGVLECIDPRDGSRQWRGKRFGQGQILVVNDHILVSAEDGSIALVTTKTEGDWKPGTIVSQIPVIDGVTWNVPTIAGPYILIRNSEQAACLTTE